MAQYTDEIKKIRELASRFRGVMERAKNIGKLEPYVALCRFPKGSCGETVNLLGEYLTENGFENLWYVSGRHYGHVQKEGQEFNEMQTHAWISIGHPFSGDAIIVDITGDQFRANPEFGNFNCPVYVGKMGDFHRLFEIGQTEFYRFSGIESYNDLTRRRLSEIYTMLKQESEMEGITSFVLE